MTVGRGNNNISTDTSMRNLDQYTDAFPLKYEIEVFNI